MTIHMINKTYTSFKALLLCSCLLASCNQEDVSIDDPVEIKLSVSVLSNSTRGVSFDQQASELDSKQNIGVTITGASADHNNVAWSIESDNQLSCSDQSPLFYGSTPATIIAYYPYNSAWSSLDSKSFSVQADQSDPSSGSLIGGYIKSDLLWTKKVQGKTTESVNLEFSHVMAKINVSVIAANFSDSEKTTTTITISNTNLNANVDLTTGTVTPSATTNVEDIIASNQALTGSAIIVPQTLAADTELLSIMIGGKKFSHKLAEETVFESGKSYTYTVTVSKGAGTILVSEASVTEWQASADGEEEVDGIETFAGTIDGHDYVDLGLPSRTLWATCNLGADTPGAEGKLYAWGEVVAKNEVIEGYGSWTGAQNANYVSGQTRTTYDRDHYKWYSVSVYTYTKYNATDGLTILDSSDDAATVNWGSNWCMPTPDQLTELRTNCSVSWGSYLGVASVKVVGPNGNFIFLPATSYVNNTIYWSSGLQNTVAYVSSLSFAPRSGTALTAGSAIDRYKNAPIRPVVKQ